MATHSSILAWSSPQTEKTDQLWSIVQQRVEYDQSDLARMHTHVKPKLLICLSHTDSLHCALLSTLVAISLFSTSASLFLFCR